MSVETYAPGDAATILHAEGARIGLLSCPICGAGIVLDPRAETNAAETHNQWHQRQVGMREPSAPLYEVGDRIRLRTANVTGTVVDRWSERGPLHCYTIRYANRLLDVVQDEIESAPPG